MLWEKSCRPLKCWKVIFKIRSAFLLFLHTRLLSEVQPLSKGSRLAYIPANLKEATGMFDFIENWNIMQWTFQVFGILALCENISCLFCSSEKIMNLENVFDLDWNLVFGLPHLLSRVWIILFGLNYITVPFDSENSVIALFLSLPHS